MKQKLLRNVVWALLVFGNVKIGAAMKQNNPEQNHAYCVILAGGSGERLWPLSRVGLPKQLLAVGQEKSLLEQAIDRVSTLVTKEHIWISTTAHHEHKIRDYVEDMIGGIIAEPGSRNTGPAILLCCIEIYKRDPQAVIAFLPADPFIPAKEHFADFLEHAFDFVTHNDRIALLGLKPRYAATGYGYIEFDEHQNYDGLFPVVKFHEKPHLEVAQQYINQQNMLWNIGMFCGKASVFLHEFMTHAPEMTMGVQNYCAGKGFYNDVVSDSIDYAVMEKSKNICVLPVDFSWCDVGNLEIFLTLKKEYGHTSEQVIAVDAYNNLVDVPNKLVALVGVDDLCIVDTGDTLLVTKRSEAEKVKAVVRQLKESKQHKYL